MSAEDDDRFASVVRAIRDRVDPTPEERERLEAVVDELTDRAGAAVADLPVEASVTLVGSTARGTWIAGDRDIDLFVAFPPDLSRERLESFGLAVGHEVLSDGREEYAEHPYVVGEFRGYDVDLVPCFDVSSATEIRSAVDRTPFHSRYLEDCLDDDLAAEVRVCKQFCKGIGVYGSDLRTRGFSGFLVELLVCEFGGFRQLLGTAADWHPPVELDPEDHATSTFEDPLVVVDPTDPGRNVAAVCSAENLARFQHHARDLLTDPRTTPFEHDRPAPLSPAQTRRHVEARGTTPVAVRFDAPDVVDDQLWPQLEKSLAGLTGELDRRGFDVFRAEAFADETAVLFVELAVAERPAVERHEGPPVGVRDHATEFYDKYADSANRAALDPPYGPFVDGDRYVVEREREFAAAAAFCRSDALFDVALGAHVESALDEGYDVVVGGAVDTLAAEFGTELARYFSPTP